MNILLIQQRDWAIRIGIPLAEFLRERLPEARFAAVVAKPSTWRFLKRHPFRYEHTWMFQKCDDEVLSPDFDRKYGRYTIDEIERTLGIDSVWRRLISVERLLVNTPAKKLRYSWDKQVDDQTALNIVKVNFGLVEDIFARFSPDIIITPGFGSLFHNVLYHYAKSKGVGMWMVTATKISGYSILENDNMYRLEPVAARYRRQEISEESRRFAQKYIAEFRDSYIPPENFINRRFATPVSPWQWAKTAATRLHRVPRRIYRVWQNSRDPLHPRVYRMLDALPPHLEARERIRKHLAIRRTLSMEYHKPAEGERFVYFPLHFQPEISTNLWATYFTNQIEVARLLAISLPGRYVLYVKEHPMMVGKRDPKYHKKFLGLPNVKLIHPYYPGHKLVGHPGCVAVACLSGTTGFEAALMKKPVMLFSETFYGVLPHCHKVTDLTKVTEIIHTLQNVDLGEPSYEEALVQYVAALKEEAFESRYASMWGLGRTGDMGTLQEAILKKVRAAEHAKYPERENSSASTAEK